MKPQSIMILGRRWQDSAGNTYHSTRAWIDSKPIPEAATNFAYGYGNQYLHAASDALAPFLDGYLGNEASGPLWRWAADNGVSITYEAEDVKRKKDLHGEGKKA